jgi:hypothetical protein
MKRTTAIIAALIAPVLAICGCVSNQPSAQAPKAGKALVTKLPAGIQGVEMVGNTVRVKSGFNWVKHPNGTWTVARMGGGGGLGVGGTWSCDCTTGANSCDGETSDGTLKCVSRDCLSCKLTVKKDGRRYAIIAY